MKAKKPYQKPEVREVELRPEEAVLTACVKAGSQVLCFGYGADSNCLICRWISS